MITLLPATIRCRIFTEKAVRFVEYFTDQKGTQTSILLLSVSRSRALTKWLQMERFRIFVQPKKQPIPKRAIGAAHSEDMSMRKMFLGLTYTSQQVERASNKILVVAQLSYLSL